MRIRKFLRVENENESSQRKFESRDREWDESFPWESQFWDRDESLAEVWVLSQSALAKVISQSALARFLEHTVNWPIIMCNQKGKEKWASKPSLIKSSILRNSCRKAAKIKPRSFTGRRKIERGPLWTCRVHRRQLHRGYPMRRKYPRAMLCALSFSVLELRGSQAQFFCLQLN